MILLLEDSHQDVLAARVVFENLGVRNPILVLTDGDEAIRYLNGDGAFSDRTRHPLPNIILLDLKMPRVDGFQVLEWIKRHPIPGRPLIVVLSAYDEPNKLALAYALGANSFLIKPCRTADVRELIQTYPNHWILESVAFVRENRGKKETPESSVKPDTRRFGSPANHPDCDWRSRLN